MNRLDPLARVRVTAAGAEFNRFAVHVLRIGTTPMGPSFFNTATATHMHVIPRAVIVTTANTRVYQEAGAPGTLVRCASDNCVQAAPYLVDPVDDLCVICPKRDHGCVVTTPALIVSREGSAWRVFRIDLSGENAERAKLWERTRTIERNFEHEADIKIGLDATRIVELRRGPPERIPTSHAYELRELAHLLRLLPVHAVMRKERAR